MDTFDISDWVKIKTTSNNDYLKTHNIKSAINNNQSLLKSFLIFRGSSRDIDLETKIGAYENLAIDKPSDKYEYIFQI